jgi:sugar phosphate isomerase/epimerase
VKLAFSTLACPKWSPQEAIAKAVEYGYDGLEWRLVDGRFIDREFPLDRATEIGRACREAGLAVAALDTSIDLAAPPGPERAALLDETRQMLRLATEFGAEFLRVFPGAFAPEAGSDVWLREILTELGPDARAAGVQIALELHDSRDAPGIRGESCSSFLRKVFEGADLPGTGVQWDLGNPYLEGEVAADTWRNIRPWLLYLQVKDMAEVDGEWGYVATGEGGLPIRDVAEWVGGRQFDGWASFEWEKYWNPQIPEPEAVLPGYVKYLSEYR